MLLGPSQMDTPSTTRLWQCIGYKAGSEFCHNLQSLDLQPVPSERSHAAFNFQVPAGLHFNTCTEPVL